jgi:ABC-2 type transport system permease protein
MPRLRAMTASFRQQAFHFLSAPSWLIPNIIAPFVITMVVLLMYQEVTGPAILYAVLGGGMMGMWGNTLYASGYSIQSERWWGTIEAVLVVPSSLIWIIAGRTIWNALIGVVNGLLVLVIAVVAFGVPMDIADPFMFIVSFLMTMFSLAALGLLFSSAFVLTRQAGVLTNGLEFPIYVASGCLFPIILLPGWAHPLSMSLAPTWGIDAIREAAGFSPEDSIWATVLGASPDAGFILLDLAMVALLAIVYIAVAVILFRVVEKQARLTGELGRV